MGWHSNQMKNYGFIIEIMFFWLVCVFWEVTGRVEQLEMELVWVEFYVIMCLCCCEDKLGLCLWV